MKRILTTLICAAVLLTSSIAFSAVDGSRISLGKIYPGMSETDLVNAFGQPNYRNEDDWNYGTFTVEVEHGIVEKITTYSDTLTTPDGVRVGLAATALNSSFGQADKIDRDYDGDEYEYFSNDGRKKIEFKVNNGVITKITCKLRD